MALALGIILLAIGVSLGALAGVLWRHTNRPQRQPRLRPYQPRPANWRVHYTKHYERTGNPCSADTDVLPSVPATEAGDET
jgi:hypothetical protein